MLWSLGAGALTLAAGGLAWRAPWRPAEMTAEMRALALTSERERRPTLEPASFSGAARRAYEVAREMPGVLDRLRCYCRCESVGHVSLLSCYTDLHGST